MILLMNVCKLIGLLKVICWFFILPPCFLILRVMLLIDILSSFAIGKSVLHIILPLVSSI